MRIGRNIIISAILALGASGSILASAAVPAAVRRHPAPTCSRLALSASPNTCYHT